MRFTIDVEVDDREDLADFLVNVAERIEQGYEGGPGWRLDEADADEPDDDA